MRKSTTPPAIYIYIFKCDRPRTSTPRLPQEANNNENNTIILEISKQKTTKKKNSGA